MSFNNKDHHKIESLLFDQRGVALFLVIFSVAILSVVMIEILYTSRVQQSSTENIGDANKAYYLARTGIMMGLLELQIHDTLSKSSLVTQFLQGNTGMLDVIWQLGFAYPPPLSPEGGGIEKSAAEAMSKKSSVDGNIATSIEDLSSRINLNLLAENKESVRKAIASQIENLIGSRKADPEFAKKYINLNVEELVNDITDYIDSDRERITGGDEDVLYRSGSTQQLPLNRPFVTILQVRGVRGVDEGLFELLAGSCTVYGGEGINVNTASAEVLKSISSELSDEDVAQIIERRASQPFKDQADFETFAKGELNKSGDFNRNPQVTLSGKSRIFSIRSEGQVGEAVRTIMAVADKERTSKGGGPLILFWNSD